jgi:hypothetical protein
LNRGDRKLSKFLMEEHLSHKFGMDVDISLGGLYTLMPQHLFDLIDGSTDLEEVLGISVSQPIA